MEGKKRTLTKWLYWFVFAVAVILVYKTVDNLGEISIWFKKLFSIFNAVCNRDFNSIFILYSGKKS